MIKKTRLHIGFKQTHGVSDINRKLKLSRSKWDLNMQRLPVMEGFRWHVVHIQPHKTTHVSWFEESTRHRNTVSECLWRATQVLCLDTLHGGRMMKAKHTNMGQGREDWWEFLMRTASPKWNSQHSAAHFWLVCKFLTKIRKCCRTGSFKCGNMLLFYHPLLSPSSCFHVCPSSSSSSSPLVRNLLLTAPVVCLLFMSNVFVAGSPHKAARIDWKTIQFLGGSAGTPLWSGLKLCSRVVWCERHYHMAHSNVSKIHPQADWLGFSALARLLSM